MVEDRTLVVQRAAERLREEYTPVLELLVKCDGGAWYLREKIANAPQADVRNNSRPLKYAYNFVLNDADVVFLREGKSPTPDLKVRFREWVFFLEVRKFETDTEQPTGYPAAKLVHAVVRKKRQLPPSEIGFVAVDNFDLVVESDLETGFTHRHISDGLCEIRRLADSNPSGWSRLSGVIVAAHTSGGASSTLPIRIPHYIWTNEHAQPHVPPDLVDWICSSLPDGEVLDVREDGLEGLSLQGNLTLEKR